MQETRTRPDARVWFVVWLAVAVICAVAGARSPDLLLLPSGQSLLTLVIMVAGVLSATNLLIVLTNFRFKRAKKPEVEVQMVSSIYRLLAVFAIALSIAYAFGALSAFTSFFAMFGGMLLGWSLQAPVSGLRPGSSFLKRPFAGDACSCPARADDGVEDRSHVRCSIRSAGRSVAKKPWAVTSCCQRDALQPGRHHYGHPGGRLHVGRGGHPHHPTQLAVAERMCSTRQEVTADIIQATAWNPHPLRPGDYGVYRLRYQTRDRTRQNRLRDYQADLSAFRRNRPSTSPSRVYSYRASHSKEAPMPGQRLGARARDRRRPHQTVAHTAHRSPRHAAAGRKHRLPGPAPAHRAHKKAGRRDLRHSRRSSSLRGVQAARLEDGAGDHPAQGRGRCPLPLPLTMPGFPRWGLHARVSTGAFTRCRNVPPALHHLLSSQASRSCSGCAAMGAKLSASRLSARPSEWPRPSYRWKVTSTPAACRAAASSSAP